MRQAWIDFNDIHDGRATTLMKFVEDGVHVQLGATLLVGDYDGNLCQATVTGVEGQLVELSIDPDSFRASHAEGHRYRLSPFRFQPITDPLSLARLLRLRVPDDTLRFRLHPARTT